MAIGVPESPFRAYRGLGLAVGGGVLAAVLACVPAPAALESIAAALTDQDVLPLAALQQVVTGTAADHVVAGQADQPVLTAKARHHIATGRAATHVGAGGAEDR